LLNVYIQNILFAHCWKHTLLVVNSLAYRLIYFLNLRFRSKYYDWIRIFGVI